MPSDSSEPGQVPDDFLGCCTAGQPNCPIGAPYSASIFVITPDPQVRLTVSLGANAPPTMVPARMGANRA